MATNMILKDRNGETVYPSTMTRYVYNDAGVDLDALLDDKVSKQPGKGLSQEDFTSGLKEKLDALPTNEELGNSLADKQGVLALTEDLIFGADGKLGLTELAKKRLFCDLFNAAAGVYGYARITDGKFDCELNGLKLTYEEAVKIYSICAGWYKNVSMSSASAKLSGNLGIKTALPIYYGTGDIHLDLNGFAHSNFSIETIRFVPIALNNLTDNLNYAFYGCSKLRHIYGAIYLRNTVITTAAFHNCSALETVSLYGLAVNLDLRACKVISRASLRYLVDYSNATNAISVLVHPDVYAKLTGDTTNQAAAALTEEELAQWQQLMVDAADKHIIFATV